MPEFEVESFEHVAATPGTVLLRVSGRWRSADREQLPAPTLTVDDGQRTHRLTALPGLDDAAPLAGPDAPHWRAAYPAPAALVATERLAFALDAGGALAGLPHPVEAAVGRRGGPAATPRAARDERRTAMQALQDALDAERRAHTEAEHALRAERAARERAEAAVAAGEEGLTALRAELAEARGDAARHDDLAVAVERAGAAATQTAHERIATLEAALTAERERGDAHAAELDAARQHLVRLEAVAAEAHELVEQRGAEAAAAVTEREDRLAEAEAEAAALRERLADVERYAVELEERAGTDAAHAERDEDHPAAPARRPVPPPARRSAQRVSALPRERPARRRAEARYLPSERTFGLALLLFGAALALLLAFGFVRFVALGGG